MLFRSRSKGVDDNFNYKDDSAFSLRAVGVGKHIFASHTKQATKVTL